MKITNLMLFIIIVMLGFLINTSETVTTDEIAQIVCSSQDLTFECSNVIGYCEILDYPNKIYYNERQCIFRQYDKFLNNLSKYD